MTVAEPHAFARAAAKMWSEDEDRIPRATLKGWEQGRRRPDATAAAYLAVIARLPAEAREVLGAA